MSFLPGHFPAAFGGPAAALSSIAQQATSSSSAQAITCPTVIAGDLIVLWEGLYGPMSISGSFPPGFTSAQATSISQYRLSLSYKIADGTESGASLTGILASGYSSLMRKGIATFRGDTAITSVTVGSPNGQLTTGNPTAQNCTAGGGVVPLVVVAGFLGVGAFVGVRTFSPAKDSEVVCSDQQGYLAWKIYNSSPANVSIDTNDNSTGSFNAGFNSCYLQLS